MKFHLTFLIAAMLWDLTRQTNIKVCILLTGKLKKEYFIQLV